MNNAMFIHICKKMIVMQESSRKRNKTPFKELVILLPGLMLRFAG